MKINPFKEKPVDIDKSYDSWSKMSAYSYDKKTASP